MMQTPRQFDPALGQLVIDDEAFAAIGGVLDQLFRECRATSAMVLDQAGQIIVWRGESLRDQRVQLGALVAGVFASTREVARILDETGFKSFLQEGVRDRVYSESIGVHWLVTVVFGRRVHLGLVKLLSGRAAIELNNVLERTLERSQSQPRPHHLGVDIVASDTIDLLFRDDVEKNVD